MAVTGKTGADALYKNFKKSSITMSHYGPKFAIVVQQAVIAGVISSADATAVMAAINALPAVLSILAQVAKYSGF